MNDKIKVNLSMQLLSNVDGVIILMNGELYEKLGRERLQDLFLNFAEEFGEND